MLTEHDNAGFPLSYCLLTMATAMNVQKRLKALESWIVILRDQYGVVPRFVHTDKDMVEIGASRRTWPASKHQLCWWHLHEAVKRRLKGNLPTSVYHPQWATCEHSFIKPSFIPYGRTDPHDTEGAAPGEVCAQEYQHGDASTMPPPDSNPNSIKIRIPAPATSESPAVTEPITHPTTFQHAEDQHSVVGTDNPRRITIRIPPPSSTHNATSTTEDEPNEEVTNGRHTFCPMEHRDAVVEMMEHHLCAHPLIPGYSAPTPEGIKAWAVKQVYDFCVLRDLPNLWAYLWENWYRRGRWELWARCLEPKEIPRLKTTMIVEAQ